MGRLYAQWPGVCDRCEHTYAQGSEIVRVGNQWVHPQCAPGGSDD